MKNKYYIRCFKKEIEEYWLCLYKAYKQTYGHLYSDEQIEVMTYNDVWNTIYIINSNSSNIICYN